MDTLHIYGYDWVRLNDVCDILRVARDHDFLTDKDDTLQYIACMMFYDKLHAAKTPEEEKAAIELPGEFVVVKNIGKKKCMYFYEWKDGKAMTGNDFHQAMIFTYEEMARHVAEKLGDGWRSACIGIESHRLMKRLLRNGC